MAIPNHKDAIFSQVYSGETFTKCFYIVFVFEEFLKFAETFLNNPSVSTQDFAKALVDYYHNNNSIYSIPPITIIFQILLGYTVNT